MNISRRTILVIVSTFIGLVFILAIASDLILLNSFAKLEKKLLYENIVKIQYEMRESLGDMDASAGDYVALIRKNGPGEIGTLNVDSLANHHVDFVAVFDAAGKLLSAKSADYHFRTPAVFDSELALTLGEIAIFAIQNKDRHLSGAIRSGARLHLVVAKPCDGGVLLAGRNIDREEIVQLSDINEFTLDIRQVRDSGLPADFREALSLLDAGAAFHVVPLDESSIAGYALFNDINGQPLFLAKLTEQRLLYQQGKVSITYILAALCISCFVFCCVMLFFVRGTVLKRLEALGATVRQISNNRDITSRLKLTEHSDELDDLALNINGMLESLEHAEDALREREEQYRILFERAPDSILLLGMDGEDEAGRIIAANEAAANQHGYAVNVLCGMNIHDLNTPESNEVATDWMARICNGQWITFEAWHFRKDGARFPLEVHAGPIKLNGKNYILRFDRDITSRKLAEKTDHMYMEQIRQLNTELARQANGLEAANSELEAFNYSVSHDLRGPLTRISGYSQLMLEDESALDPQVRSYVSRIYESSCWLNEMIDAMLKLAQLARSEFQPQRVDLSAIVENLATEFGVTEPQRQPEVVIAPGVTVVGDLRLLKILMTNLFNNAWKYTAYSASPRIEFGVLNDGPVPVFYISDTGAGFDMKDVGRLFRVFSRLHDPGQFAGSGIGLATVQRIVTRHGGRIWAEGEPQKGATFFFTLQPENPTVSSCFAS